MGRDSRAADRAASMQAAQTGRAMNSLASAAASAGGVPAGISGVGGVNLAPQREQAASFRGGIGSATPLPSGSAPRCFQSAMNFIAARI